jgi:hypothetical protein
MVDDGTNSGIPEINASGLSVAEDDKTFMAGINLLSGILGFGSVLDSLWNGGGIGVGLGANKTTNGFGKFEFFGNDSVRLSVVDENGFVLGTVTVLHSSRVAVNRGADFRPGKDLFQLVYPSPSKGRVRVVLGPDFQAQPGDYLRISNATGQTVRRMAMDTGSNQYVLNLEGLPAGVYQISVLSQLGIFTHKVVLE